MKPNQEINKKITKADKVSIGNEVWKCIDKTGHTNSHKYKSELSGKVSTWETLRKKLCRKNAPTVYNTITRGAKILHRDKVNKNAYPVEYLYYIYIDYIGKQYNKLSHYMYKDDVGEKHPNRQYLELVIPKNQLILEKLYEVIPDANLEILIQILSIFHNITSGKLMTNNEEHRISKERFQKFYYRYSKYLNYLLQVGLIKRTVKGVRFEFASSYKFNEEMVEVSHDYNYLIPRFGERLLKLLNVEPKCPEFQEGDFIRDNRLRRRIFDLYDSGYSFKHFDQKPAAIESLRWIIKYGNCGEDKTEAKKILAILNPLPKTMDISDEQIQAMRESADEELKFRLVQIETELDYYSNEENYRQYIADQVEYYFPIETNN